MTEPPLIFSVSPGSGQQSRFTRIRIDGRNLGSSIDDIVNVGIIAKDTFDSSQSLLSCLGTARVVEPGKTIECHIGAVDAGYSQRNNKGKRSVNLNTRGGFVFVQTRHGSSWNESVEFDLQPSCFMYSSEKTCTAHFCNWCLYNARCVSLPNDCSEDCSTKLVQMTCNERTGIIITLILLGFLLIFLVFFSRARLASIRRQKQQPPPPLLPPQTCYHHSGNVSEDEEDDDDEFIGQNYSYAYEYRRWEIERKHNALKRTDKLVSFHNVLE